MEHTNGLTSAISAAARTVQQKHLLDNRISSMRTVLRRPSPTKGSRTLSGLQSGQQQLPSLIPDALDRPSIVSRSPSAGSEGRTPAFVQAENMALERENTILRRRASDLEKQLSILQTSAGIYNWANDLRRPQTGKGPRTRIKGSGSSADSLPSGRHPAHAPVKDAIAQAARQSLAEVAAAGVRSASASSTSAAVSSEPVHEEWTAAAWLASLRTTHIIASGLLKPLGVAASDGGDPRLELAFIRSLGQCASREAMKELLAVPTLLDELADEIWRAADELAKSVGGSGAELHEKFQQEADVFTMEFGGLSNFFGGLEQMVGPPSPHLRMAMKQEHCNSADSNDSFESTNYGTTTTPAVEFAFVVHPELGPASAGVTSWPQETKLPDSRRRQPRPLASFLVELQRINRRLSQLGCAAVTEDELLGCRLYTGPLFVKYNTVLRGCRSKSSRQFARWYAGCRGNRYTVCQRNLHTSSQFYAH